MVIQINQILQKQKKQKKTGKWSTVRLLVEVE